jgi:hypothetical protein
MPLESFRNFPCFAAADSSVLRELHALWVKFTPAFRFPIEGLLGLLPTVYRMLISSSEPLAYDSGPLLHTNNSVQSGFQNAT